MVASQSTAFGRSWVGSQTRGRKGGVRMDSGHLGYRAKFVWEHRLSGLSQHARLRRWCDPRAVCEVSRVWLRSAKLRNSSRASARGAPSGVEAPLSWRGQGQRHQPASAQPLHPPTQRTSPFPWNSTHAGDGCIPSPHLYLGGTALAQVTDGTRLLTKRDRLVCSGFCERALAWDRTDTGSLGEQWAMTIVQHELIAMS